MSAMMNIFRDVMAKIMKIKQKLYLAGLLTPAFWLLLIWIYFVSPVNVVLSIATVLAYSLAIACICSYCVTLFVVAFGQLGKQSECEVERK